MANDGTRRASRFHDFETIKTLLLDSANEADGKVKDRLIDVGVRGISSCDSPDALCESVQSEQPDLLILDLDTERDVVCKVIQAVRSQDIKTSNPFAVIIGVTGDSGRETVAAALDAGVDSLLAKPVAAAALRACLKEQIENRAEFIATADYVGPDRRPGGREESDEELVSVEVPNTLQDKATGVESDEPVEEKIARTMRSLGAQRSWLLARKMGTLAENARRAVSSGSDFPLLGETVEALEATLSKIESLDAELNLSSVREVVTSTRASLEMLAEAGDEVDARHFELLRVHSHSIGIAMEEDDSMRDVLVTELGRAVSVVRGDAADAALGGQAEATDGYSWKVRLRAWWEGVEPGEIAPASQ